MNYFGQNPTGGSAEQEANAGAYDPEGVWQGEEEEAAWGFGGYTVSDSTKTIIEDVELPAGADVEVFEDDEAVGHGFGDLPVDDDPTVPMPPTFGDLPPAGTFIVVGAPTASDYQPNGIFSDEGGDIVRLYGNYKDGLGLVDPPYIVRLEGPNGLPGVTPSAGGCYSAKFGKLDKLHPNSAKDILAFALPPLKLGTYNILIQDTHGATLAKVSNCIRIERRNRDRETYQVRRRLPGQVYAAGVLAVTTEADYGS